MESKTLLDLIDLEYLQKLQERIAAIVGFSLILLDAEGEQITEPSNPLGFCRIMQDSLEGREKCNSINSYLCTRTRETLRPATTICPHTGLTTAAAPFFLGEQFLGIWMIGQVRLLDAGAGILIKDDNFQIGGQLRQLLESIPTMWRSGLHFVLDLLSQLLSESIWLLNSNLALEDKHQRIDGIITRIQNTMTSLRVYIDSEDILIYITDYETGKILMCNEVFAEFFGKRVEELIEAHCYEVFGKDDFCSGCPREKLLDSYGNLLPAYSWEYYVDTVDRWLQCTHRASYWMDGRLVQFVTCADITRRKQLEQEVNRLAFEDKLLGIPNSVCLERDIRQNGSYEYLVVLDIQGLRKINDVYGRTSGDSLLKAVRDYIAGMGYPGATLYRLEVADFGILVQRGETAQELPTQIAEQMAARCKHSWTVQTDNDLAEVYVMMNVCIVPVDDCAEQYNQLQSIIEHTLETARKTGTVAVYNDLIDHGIYSSLKLELSLKNAVWENMKGFYLVFQPIIDPGLAIWHSIEVLCRWDSPELGPVPPLEFIPVAESSGLIRTIGFWVLDNAVRHVKSWQLDEIDGFLLEVNLSPGQLEIPDLDQSVLGILGKYDYPPEKLCLEITESNELNFSNNNLRAIEKLHETGVVIALDDFGTGYSSFNSLHKLPAEILKTDRSFITGMENDPFLQRLFFVMVELAHGSGMKIVAEGVETEFQSKFLYKQGADLFQGYLFSKPLTAKQMEQHLHRFRVTSSELINMGYARMDKTVLGEPSGYTFSPALNKVLNACMQALFGMENPHEAIQTAITLLGKALRVNRAYFYLKQPDNTYSMLSEWCTDTIGQTKTETQHIDLDKYRPEWMQMLHREGLLAVSDVAVLDQKLYEMFSNQGIRSLVQFPLWRDGQITGLIGFDMHLHTRNWSREEVQLIHTVSMLITFTISKEWLRGEVIYHAEMLKSIFDQIHTMAYVTDLDTDEIVFASSALRKLKGEVEGETCWKALYGKRARCSFCPIPHLEEHPGETYEWESFNKEVERYYRVRDTIISWGSHKAHLQYAEDISDIKRYQKQMGGTLPL